MHHHERRLWRESHFLVGLAVFATIGLTVTWITMMKDSSTLENTALRNETVKIEHIEERYVYYDDNRMKKMRPMQESVERNNLQHAYDAIESMIMPMSQIEEFVGRALTSNQTKMVDNMGEMNLEAFQDRIVYVITPTYKRVTQIVDLTRLSATLQAAWSRERAIVYWVVIEDSETCTQRVRKLLEDSQLPYAHISVKSPAPPSMHSGVNQRNLALKVVKEVGVEGVIYFADDDNAYSLELFNEIRHTIRVAVFASGFSGGSVYERCVVNATTGKVIGFYSNWHGHPNLPRRAYSMDMGSMAFSTAMLLERKPQFNASVLPGYLESEFMAALVSDMSELQPLGANCTRILYWHVRTNEGSNIKPVKEDGEYDLLQNLVQRQ